AERAARAVLYLERDADLARSARTEEALGSALREPAGGGAHQLVIGAVGAADEVRVCADRLRDSVSLWQLLESREGVGHAVEGEREGDDAAAVGRGSVRFCLGCLGVGGGAGLLDRVLREAVALGGPAVRAAEGEHARVLARAVVEELPGRPPLLQAELEVVLRRGC